MSAVTLPPDWREKWNPRYVAYAAEHNRTPDEMRDHDREAWPGGCAVGFMLWISQAWQAWERAHGRDPRHLHDRYKSPAEHERFTRWLLQRAGIEITETNHEGCESHA